MGWFSFFFRGGGRSCVFFFLNQTVCFCLTSFLLFGFQAFWFLVLGVSGGFRGLGGALLGALDGCFWGGAVVFWSP